MNYLSLYLTRLSVVLGLVIKPTHREGEEWINLQCHLKGI